MAEARNLASAEGTQKYKRFGFVLPDGSFLAADFSEHEEAAYAQIEQKGWRPDYRKWRKLKDEGDPAYAVDFLVYEKGYVLLHDPTRTGRVIVTQSPHKTLTKAQRETLYDYFIENGDQFMANQYMNDEKEVVAG